MKNKIVVWGTNAENEKVLIALELQADTNKVLLYTFPESIAAEEFVNKMMAEWRSGNKVDFPEGHTVLERELSVTEGLLPDDLRVERGDLIQRAQTEWHFAVLSAKLHQAYEQELAEFKEKVEALQAYDHHLWDNLRGFWDKVQEQARERNLFREHADQLRDNINVMFDEMKKMRARVQDEFTAVSQKVYEDYNKTLVDIEARIASGGAKMNSVFEDLKQLQRRYRDAKMSNEHRNQLWERLDKAFKAAKERKFGPSANEGSLVERHERRLEGLRVAMHRMQDSVKRDQEELDFQQKKVAATEGQLEAQIRSAKIKMIEERVSSKREKLAEMERTRADVERQVNIAKDKENKRVEKEAERQKLAAAKEAAKSEIAASIKSKSEEAPVVAQPESAKTEEEPAAQPEAEQPAEKAKDEPSLLDAAGILLGEAFEDVVDTVKAVGKVLGEKADEMLEDAVEKVEEVAEVLTKEKKKAPKKPAETPVVVEEPVAAEEPVVEEPVAAEEPVVAETPVAVKEPVVAETPVAVEEPVVEAPAETSDESAATTEPPAPTADDDKKDA